MTVKKRTAKKAAKKLSKRSVAKKSTKTKLSAHEKFLSKVNKFEISHFQAIKISQNYQSADASYGVRLECDPADRQAAVDFAEYFVEELLANKVTEHQGILNDLS